ncbi:hypothetical protein SIAM614_17174 [Stappia aggregata IAM 12614]|uniref:DUF2975 domain-containing protein n=1 Tax=Roseibium aggregatum (strain ATCC 25650 / DSM 13394 / JCM 20685 / NBRC 16684 / NCIMB 2208 / IAM 12614 / B1) TaxID=384765 RepID=A0P2A1_ROSAI|nr:hypothetical protein [Roseibium aggregatum]EAV40765.1 hypothetical protein SIAM614_17174 [Stappia aggregata IAM 12614] [Roseibium aggregatum IAM 12614]
MSELEWAEREKRLTRIRRVSAFMKWAVTFILLILVVLGLVITIGIALPNDLMIGAEETFDVADTERMLGDIPQVQRIGISVLAAIAFGLVLAVGWNIRQVFKRFQRMEFFSPKTLANVFAFGIWLIVFAVFDLISDPIGSIILTYDFPPGQRAVDVSLDGGEIFFFVLGALMLLFGWILREAALIADENQQFI